MGDLKTQLFSTDMKPWRKKLLFVLFVSFSFLSPAILAMNSSKLLPESSDIFYNFLGILVVQSAAQILSGYYILKNALPNYLVGCISLMAWLGQFWAGFAIVLIFNA